MDIAEMKKELSEMSLEELWQRFPIFLVAHKDEWKAYYLEMESFLKTILSGYPVARISHIGSTAISRIWAKDIVDMLVEVSGDFGLEDAAKIIERNGFIRMSTGTDRISLNRGYTEDGFADRVFHVHLRYAGDHDELYFRDYLNEHTKVAREYETLKLQLWEQFEHNRDAYTDAKAEFVRRWTSEAKKAYAGRYDMCCDVWKRRAADEKY